MVGAFNRSCHKCQLQNRAPPPYPALPMTRFDWKFLSENIIIKSYLQPTTLLNFFILLKVQLKFQLPFRIYFSKIGFKTDLWICQSFSQLLLRTSLTLFHCYFAKTFLIIIFFPGCFLQFLLDIFWKFWVKFFNCFCKISATFI